MHECSDSTAILISQVCVILRKMIVDSAERGWLGDEVDHIGNSVDVVQEFVENDSSRDEEQQDVNDAVVYVHVTEEQGGLR